MNMGSILSRYGDTGIWNVAWFGSDLVIYLLEKGSYVSD
jgi:hypothetical protein